MDNKKNLELELNELNQKSQEKVKEELQKGYSRIKSLDRAFGGKYKEIEKIHQEALNSIGSSLEDKNGVLQIPKYFQECKLSSLMEYARFLDMSKSFQSFPIFFHDSMTDNEIRISEIVDKSEIKEDERKKKTCESCKEFEKMEWVKEVYKVEDDLGSLSKKIQSILKYRVAKMLVSDYEKILEESLKTRQNTRDKIFLKSYIPKVLLPAIEAGYQVTFAAKFIAELSRFEKEDLQKYQIDGSNFAKHFIQEEMKFSPFWSNTVFYTYNANILIYSGMFHACINRELHTNDIKDFLFEDQAQMLKDIIISAKQYSEHPIDLYAQILSICNGQVELEVCDGVNMKQEYTVNLRNLKEMLERFKIDPVYNGVDILNGQENGEFQYASSIIQQDIDFYKKCILLPAFESVLSSEQREELERPINSIVPPEKGVVETLDDTENSSNNVNNRSVLGKKQDVGVQPEQKSFSSKLGDIISKVYKFFSALFLKIIVFIKGNKEEKQHTTSIIDSPLEISNMASQEVDFTKN